MKDYFLLQYKMANRKLSHWGINPLIAYVLMAAGFIIATEYLYIKTEYAPYILVFAAANLLTKAAEVNRSEFLQMVFGTKKYRLVRLIENLIIALPFAAILFYHQAILIGMLLLTGGIAVAGISLKTKLNFTIPTPFYKNPFEFIVGFRNTYFLFPLAYALVVIAIAVNNVNLGIAAMLAVFVICFSYYSKPENEYFVWSFSSSPLQFITNKIKIATLYSSYLALPIAIALIAFYPDEFDNVVLFALMGYAFLWVLILAKYAAYPNPIGAAEGVLLAFCLYYPPILVAIVPYFYFKCVKNLTILLK